MRIELPISIRFALRNITRNVRRTALSLMGVIIGCGLALMNISMSKGKIEIYMRNIAEGGIGHFRVVPQGWGITHDDKLRLKNGDQELSMVRGEPKIKAATPRTRVQALLSMGTRMTGVEIVGVDPKTEPITYRYVRTLEKGRYLTAEDSHQIIIGKSIADKLHVDIGDGLVATVIDEKGSMKSDMFHVAGIVNMGSKQIESSICQVVLTDAQNLSGIPGIGEITVILKHPNELDNVIKSLKDNQTINGKDDEIMDWGEISPQSKMAVGINEGSSKIMTFILLVVALIGIVSAQLTAVLERRKEVAVLSAIGMSRIQIISLVMSEALGLGLASFAITCITIGPIIYYLSVVGIRVLEKGQSLQAVGTVIEPIIYGDFGSWFFVYAAVLCCLSTILASVYPAIFAIRLDPAEALRAAQ